MRTIKLNSTEIYSKGQTTKYWRDVECSPQRVELKTWSSDHPFFILRGIIVNSHDLSEIGRQEDVYVQTYSFFLDAEIAAGKYTVIN